MDAPPISFARSSDGTSIAYATSGEGPPLVFASVPVGASVAEQWEFPEHREFTEALGRDWMVLRYDLRGTGDSGGASRDSSRALDESRLDESARDLEAVRQAIGVTDLTMVSGFGWDPGLSIATRCHLRQPASP